MNLQSLFNPTQLNGFMLKTSSFLFTEAKQLLFISILWVILTVIINPYGEFPFNDDWAYAQSVKALVETQTFFVSGWTSVNLLVQIGWGALFCIPFGFSFTALRISTLVAGLIGLWGTHRLIYNSTENGQTAFLGTLITLVNPIYLGLSASFMTDVPFYSVMVWSLAYMIIGLKQDSVQFILISLALAVIALLIRQFGIALFAGFSVAYLVRKGVQLKSIIVAGVSVAMGLGIQVAYQRWLSYMMPGIVSYNVQASNFFHLSFYKWSLLRRFVNNTFVALMYVGLFMFPYFTIILTRKGLPAFRKDRWLWLLAVTVVIVMWQTMFDGMSMPIWFNTLSAFGLGPVLVRDIYYRLYELPMPDALHVVMIGVTILSLLGSVIICYHLIQIVRYLIRWSADRVQLTIICLLFSILGIYFFPISLHVVFDRYLLPIPILLLILIYLIQSITSQRTTERTLPFYLSMGLCVLYLIFSVCITHDYLAWNRVRWQALNEMMQQGIKPTEIDGGLEFNGWHLYKASYKAVPTRSWWWVQNDTYVAGASLLPGYELFQQHKVNTWLPWGIQEIIIGKRKPGGVDVAAN